MSASAASSSQSSQSTSTSPPESPTLVTPVQVTPQTLAMTGLSSDNSDVAHAPPLGEAGAPLTPSLGLTFPPPPQPHSKAVPATVDLSDSPTAQASSPLSNGHTSPLLTSPDPQHVALRPDDTGAFPSSSLASVPAGARERGPGAARPHVDTGFIEGSPTPPLTASPSSYTPPMDGKKEPPTDSPYDSPYGPPSGQKFKLSGAPNGSASTAYAAQGPVVPHWSESTPFWLFMYFFFNLGLTLFNKVVLVSFPFPYTLTGLHALSGCAGTYIALERGSFTPARLTQKENVILGAFSVLYTINIAVSNISLQLVTVPFHQVVRAATPLFTMFIAAGFLRQRFSGKKLVSLLPVVAGVGFATYGDYDFTAWGLILTLLGTVLAALKTVVTNVIQTGGGGRLKLHPLDLLMRMSPLAFVQCVAYGWYTGELERVRRYGATQMTRTKAIALLINGIIACGLNIVSFTANKKAGALTMTVSANCKQVLTIALAVFLFNLHITPTNGIGIFLTLTGGALYAYVEYQEKGKKRLPPARPVEKA